MLRNGMSCVYDKDHLVEVSIRDCLTEQRQISFIVHEFPNYVQVKIRDANKFGFNYTARIDAGSFDFMKKQQCLDINFNELISQLLEMLQLHLKQEMYIKCDADNGKCKLIFYEKSKIKNLIFLIIDLMMTNQDEIFEEMSSNIQNLQDANKLLNNQLQISKIKQQEYEGNIKHLTDYNKKLAVELFRQIQKIEHLVPNLIINLNTRINKEFFILQRKMVKLKDDVNITKQESELKAKSSARLANDLQKLRLECIDSSTTIEALRRENMNLQTLKNGNERVILDLRQSLGDKERLICDLQKEMDVLRKDLQNATVIIAQKTSTNDELAKDLLQANQMLVNFNNHYDMKVKEIEGLQSSLNSKEKVIKEQSYRHSELLKEFEEYRSKYNAPTEQKMSHELFLANKRIEELEKQNREASKLNGLLTKKLSSGSLINFDKM